MLSIIAVALLLAVGESCCCTLYRHCNYGGTKMCVDKYHNDLRRARINDQFSSIRVGTNCECTLFEHINRGGKRWTIKSSTQHGAKCFVHATMKTIKVSWNDHVSSVDVKKIPRPCKVSAYKNNGSCNQSNGVQNQKRTITVHPLHGPRCPALSRNVKCKVNCKQHGWRNHGSCNQSNGLQRQLNPIKYHARNGGKACGAQSRNVGCRVNCQQHGWRNHGGCNQSNGLQRQLNPIKYHPRHGGKACGAQSRNVGCRVNCQLNGFGGWSKCSKPCGRGNKRRSRSVKYHPRHGGRKCAHLVENHACNTQACCPSHCKPRVAMEDFIGADTESYGSYFSHVAVGFSGFIAGMGGLFFYKRRQEHQQYESLL